MGSNEKHETLKKILYIREINILCLLGSKTNYIKKKILEILTKCIDIRFIYYSCIM